MKTVSTQKKGGAVRMAFVLTFGRSTADTRYCELSGYSFEQKFQVSFSVTEPSMIMSNFDFEVGIEIQLDVGDVLQRQVHIGWHIGPWILIYTFRVKEECDIMGFFRLIVHYATLDMQRKQTFKKLIDEYQDTSVNVEVLSLTKLQFEGNT
jgi:hypothetical protein